MLKFITVKEAEAALDAPLLGRTGSSLTGAELAGLTQMVVDRFLKQVNWEDITEIYLSGLCGDDDLALIKRAVRALMDGGVSYGR